MEWGRDREWKGGAWDIDMAWRWGAQRRGEEGRRLK